MDMKKERRKIYLRCFALLIALWLAIMSVFTWRLRLDAKYQARQRFISLAQSTQRYFTNACIAPDRPLTDSTWQSTFNSWGGTVSSWQSCITASLFTYGGEPVWSPQKPDEWTVTLGYGLSREPVSAHMDPTRWFDTGEISRELSKLTFPHQATLTLGEVLVTEDGEAIPRTLLLEYNGETAATFSNSSFDQYEGKLYPKNNRIDFPGNAQLAVDALENREEIQKLQDLVANSSSLLEMSGDPGDPRSSSRATLYHIDDEVVYSRSWDAMDSAFVAVVGFGPIAEDTWKPNADALPVSYYHPTYWLVIAGRSNIWEAEGGYWLRCVLISLAGFLAAAWLLAHTAWKGQKAHLLYERRTRETANAIAHSLKTPMSVLHASAENLEADICPEKRGEYIAEIVRQTEAMDQALLDLLDLAADRTRA